MTGSTKAHGSTNCLFSRSFLQAAVDKLLIYDIETNYRRNTAPFFFYLHIK